MKSTALISMFLAASLLATPAFGGKGGSPEAVRRAIDSGSVDAISAELERAERLLCGACLPMVAPLVDHADARVRQVATWWLARRGLRSELFVQMAYRLAKADSRLARNAADVLGSLRHHKAIEPLGAALHNPLFDGEARAAMAGALGRIGEPRAAAALVAALRAREAPVRAAALQALRELRGPLDPAPALPLLEDPVEAVRIEAAYTIGATRGRHLPEHVRSQLVGALVERLQRDPSPRIRKKAAWALGEIGAPASLAARPLRAAATSDRDPAVRSLASAAAGKLNP